jgi:hypothetical protein
MARLHNSRAKTFEITTEFFAPSRPGLTYTHIIAATILCKSRRRFFAKIALLSCKLRGDILTVQVNIFFQVFGEIDSTGLKSTKNGEPVNEER